MEHEAVSQYKGWSHKAVADLFVETEGHPAVGAELSRRLVEHAGLPEEMLTRPLLDRHGRQIVHDGRPLTHGDYVNYAADHHFEALEPIFSFLEMQPGGEDYVTMRTAMLGYLHVAEA